MRHGARVIRDAVRASSSQEVLVEIDNVAACQRCARGQGCGTNIFRQSGKAIQLYCRSDLDVIKDQQVTVEFDEGDSRWLWLIAAAYGLPLIGMITAAAIANRFFSETGVALAAAAGLAGGIFAWRRVAATLGRTLESSLCLQTGRIVAVTTEPWIDPLIETTS